MSTLPDISAVPMTAEEKAAPPSFGHFTDVPLDYLKERVWEERPQIVSVEGYLTGLAQMGLVLAGQAERPLSKAAADPVLFQLRLTELEEIRQKILLWKQDMNGCLDLEQPDTRQDVWGRTGGVDTPQAEDMADESHELMEEERAMVERGVEGLYLLAGRIAGTVDHDLGLAIAGFSGWLQMCRRGDISKMILSPSIHQVDLSLSGLCEYVIQVIPDFLKDRISHQQIGVPSLSAAFRKYLSAELASCACEVQVAKSDPAVERLFVDYGRVLLKPLITNIGVNIRKALSEKRVRMVRGRGADGCPRQDEVSVEFVRAEDFRDENGQPVGLPEAQRAKLRPGGEYLFIIIRDTGIGFEVPEILKYGFSDGVSGFRDRSQSGEVSGTGRGMAGQQGILEEHFGGTFICLNRADVRGACLVIALRCIEQSSQQGLN